MPGRSLEPARALAIGFFPQARRAQKRGAPQGHARPRHVGPHGENRRRVSGGGPPRGIEPLSGDPQSPILTTIRRGPPVRVPTAPLASLGCADAVYARAQARAGAHRHITPTPPRLRQGRPTHGAAPRCGGGEITRTAVPAPSFPPGHGGAIPSLDRPEQAAKRRVSPHVAVYGIRDCVGGLDRRAGSRVHERDAGSVACL